MDKIQADPRPPSEAFELKELIGNGAFADVYRVKKKKNQYNEWKRKSNDYWLII